MLSTLLVWSYQQNRKVYICVSSYCAKQGWMFRQLRERLNNAFVIQADGWRLTTGMEASESNVQSGSADMAAYTRWESRPNGENACALLWFGTISQNISTKIDDVLPLLSAWEMGETKGTHVVPLDVSLEGRFLLVARDDPSLTNEGEAVSRLLRDWPQEWTLRGYVGKKTVYLSVPGKRMDKPSEMEKIIELGQGLVKRFKVGAQPTMQMAEKEEQACIPLS